MTKPMFIADIGLTEESRAECERRGLHALTSIAELNDVDLYELIQHWPEDDIMLISDYW